MVTVLLEVLSLEVGRVVARRIVCAGAGESVVIDRDILVVNAGVAQLAPIDTFPQEEFDRLMSVNVRGVFAAIQAAVTHLGSESRIITIGSVNADRVPIAGLSVYAMTKAAVAGLVRGLARELGPRGITVNNVAPGPSKQT